MEIEAVMTKEIDPQNQRVLKEAGFGLRLRAAREAMRLSEKDAAARLHLSPKIILVMENEDFSTGLPATFLRGYIRSYARLLNFSEDEINFFIMQQVTHIPEVSLRSTPPILKTQTAHSSHKFMHWMTYVITAVLIVLVSMWWVSHPKDSLSAKLAPVIATEPNNAVPAPTNHSLPPTLPAVNNTNVPAPNLIENPPVAPTAPPSLEAPIAAPKSAEPVLNSNPVLAPEAPSSDLTAPIATPEKAPISQESPTADSSATLDDNVTDEPLKSAAVKNKAAPNNDNDTLYNDEDDVY